MLDLSEIKIIIGPAFIIKKDQFISAKNALSINLTKIVHLGKGSYINNLWRILFFPSSNPSLNLS